MSTIKSNILDLPLDTRFLLAINQFPKFGPVRMQKIKNHFQSFQEAFNANPQEFEKAGIEEKVVSEFFEFKNNTIVDKVIEELINEEISVALPSCNDFPKLLTEISNPPILLYYRGNIQNYSNKYISIVGSRKFTVYGKQVAEKLATELTNSEIIIVSGLAAGIDTIAHTSCVNNDGTTFAVLGTGVEKKGIYPAINKYLADEIISNGGAVISEFPIRTAPLPHNFPQRNRIISGMSHGTLIVEAAKKSGALITAKYALEQNREVFAVPGNIYSPVSEGPNNLIKQGAIPITCTDDILNALDIKAKTIRKENKKKIPATSEEQIILNLLSQNPIHIDEITRLSKKSISEISSTLTLMELKGLITNTGAMNYILNV
jgi:DNA processing protein